MEKFVKYIDNHNRLNGGVQYLTRENINFYFANVVSKQKGTRNTIKRALWSLEWMAANRERIGESFVVSSPIVQSSLLLQQTLMKTCTTGTETDPHKGLKDRLSTQDRIKLMTYIYTSRKDWGAASVNFSWGHNGAIRGHSNRQLTYKDINISFGFGPDENIKGLNRCLLLILQKGPIHKDRHDKDEQVAVWRHKHYLCCSVFATASYVIYSLLHQYSEISFLRPD